MARRSTALVLAAAALVVSACSDEDGPGSTAESEEPTLPAPTSSEATGQPTSGLTTELVSEAAEAEAVVADFYADFAAGELDAACAWWTEEYAEVSVDGWNDGNYGPKVASCPELLTEIADVLAIVGDPAAQLQVTDLRGELADAAHAWVDVTLASAEKPETYELALTDEGWRISGDRAGDLAPSDAASGTG